MLAQQLGCMPHCAHSDLAASFCPTAKWAAVEPDAAAAGAEQ